MHEAWLWYGSCCKLTTEYWPTGFFTLTQPAQSLVWPLFPSILLTYAVTVKVSATCFQPLVTKQVATAKLYKAGYIPVKQQIHFESLQLLYQHINIMTCGQSTNI